MRGYRFQPDLFALPDRRFRKDYSPTPDELWMSGRRNVFSHEPAERTTMVALDGDTFTGVENGDIRTVRLPLCDLYASKFATTPFAIKLRIGFSGWWMTWTVTAVRRLEDSIEIDLGQRIA